MIVDAHNHPNWHGYTPESIVRNMDENDIAKTWLLSWEAPVEEIDVAFYAKKFYPGRLGMPFTDVIEAARRYPERFVRGYCPDPRVPGSLERLEAAIEALGVRICGELKLRMMFDNLDAIRMYELCARHGIPVVVHIDYPVPTGFGTPIRADFWYGGGIEPFERALKRCPRTLFVGHGPGFWSHISKDNQPSSCLYPTGPVLAGGEVPRLLHECPNLYADLSANSARNALTRDAEFGRQFLIQFQDRLLFARDCFTDELYKTLAGFDLPSSVLDKILWRNAVGLVP